MFFYIKHFRVFQVQTSSLFYSSESATLIKDSKIEAFLKGIESKTGSVVEERDIIQTLEDFGLDSEKVLSYLTKRLKLLIPCAAPAQAIDAVLIHSENLFFEKLIFEELTPLFSVPVIKIASENLEYKSPLILSFSDNFSSTHIKNLYEHFRDTQASFLTSYVLHRSIIIDGLFVPFKGTPCHFCFFSRWQNLEKNRKGISETSWYNYFQYISALPEDGIRKEVSLSLPIERSDIGLLVSILKKKLTWLVTGEVLPTMYDPRAFTRYNLDDGSWDYDVIPHWPGCGCLAESWT